MIDTNAIYCLDANVLITAWNSYYSMKFCPEYWDILNELGKQRKIFLPDAVKDEILKTEDDLSAWLKQSDILIRKVDGSVTKCLQEIYSANPLHETLVDNIKGRSLADPWLIAHAMNESATIVTKEMKTLSDSKRIRIPNVCENMNIRCINDFEFIEELSIRFNCKIGHN